MDWNNFVLNRCTFAWNGGGCFVRNGDNLIHRVYFKLE
ncbi:IgG-binding virulence factor TspB family protein, partial [Neisseria gonorrhoeae]